METTINEINASLCRVVLSHPQVRDFEPGVYLPIQEIESARCEFEFIKTSLTNLNLNSSLSVEKVDIEKIEGLISQLSEMVDKLEYHISPEADCIYLHCAKLKSMVTEVIEKLKTS